MREVPAPAGNYSSLAVNDTALFWAARDSGRDAKTHLMALEISNDEPEPETLVSDIRSYELSRDGKKLLVRQQDDLYVLAAGTKAPEDLSEHQVDLERLELHHRRARGLAADLRRRLAAGAGLLLRPGHARGRLGRRFGTSTCRWSIG